jgi:O-antigen ligase
MLTTKNSATRSNKKTKFTENWTHSSPLSFWVSAFGIIFGTIAGWLAGAKPFYLIVLLAVTVALVCFFAEFELVVMGLLIVRSSLDVFSAQQLPAAYAIGVDGLTVVYVTFLLLTRQAVRTDWFWWVFAGWTLWQALWPILCIFGGLGLGTEVLRENLREWMRLFSWLMMYLLVMQLQERIHTKKIISLLFLGLVAPIFVALLQFFLPDSVLPAVLATVHGDRLNGTMGHPNTFVTFVSFFIGLTYWKLRWSSNRLPWLLLLGLLAFVLVGTRALVGLGMLGTFVLVTIAPKFNWLNLIGGALLLFLVLGLFLSTPFGQERFQSIAQTPLLNSNIDVSRAILLSDSDNNSFNWRISQWNYLLTAWQQFPIFGYGLSTSKHLSVYNLEAHNDYIRSLAEGGIVGLTTFLFFLGAQGIRLVQLLRQTSENREQNDLCLTMLAFLIAIFVGMLTENIWSHTTLFYYWWTLFAVAGWKWEELEFKDVALQKNERASGVGGVTNNQQLITKNHDSNVS